MMDDLLSIDFNFLDEDLLSFPMDDEFNPIESREIESILNEIEHSTSEKLFDVNAYNTFAQGQIRPTIMFNNRNSNLKASKKSKSKIGTSLLARPPKKLKKDKNSLLRNNNSLLVAGNRSANNFAICQTTFLAYFYQDHNYCLDTAKLKFEQPNNNASSDIDLNNNDLKLDSLTIETKEIVIDSSNQVLKKKVNNSLSNATLNLISPTLFNGNCEFAHDLDDYFNISFSNSEETDCTSSNQSEAEDEVGLKFYLENEVNESENNENQQQVKTTEKSELEEKSCNQITNETVVKNEMPITKISELKNVLLDDLNNYNINELNTDTENELNSLEDEEEDILIETDILIDEMYSKFGDFEEFDLISSKKSSKVSKNSLNKKINRNVNSKSPKAVINTNRRQRTVSNSYSVRSGSSCSCCSEDMSEEEQPKRNDTMVPNKHQQTKSNHMLNQRKSTSKLIKADNTFIRKHKNNSRFMMHKNTSF